jgi:hypothetical protein
MHPAIIIKRFSSIDLILDCQLAMKLPLVKPYSSSIYYHQHLWNCQVMYYHFHECIFLLIAYNKGSSLYA